MKNKKNNKSNCVRKNKGITLVALVITIIVLLILAGITLNLVIGENGLIARAQQAGKDYGQVQNNEMADINSLNKEIAEYIGESSNLPENTESTEAGKIVKLPDEWGTDTMRYVSTSNGVEIADSKKIATVYAVATGNGEQVPVPYGFYYVGGNKENGVVISDNEADKNKYVGQTNIGKDLQGNQFVFIPCLSQDYAKIEWGYASTGTSWDKTTNSAEKTQIQKYGGFYVGRYEAGTSNATFKTDINATVTASNWQSDVYKIENATLESKPTTKAGEIPWNHVDQETALIASERMYNTSYVNSGLITGTQFDVMLKWMSTISDNSDLKTNSTWGNYSDIELTDCDGKYTKVTSSGTYIGTTSAWFDNTGKTNKNTGYYTILSTGASETAKKKNLYDVAGNLWERTQETAYYSTGTGYFILRGASINNTSDTNPVCQRTYNSSTKNSTNIGFRPVLYMK